MHADQPELLEPVFHFLDGLIHYQRGHPLQGTGLCLDSTIGSILSGGLRR